MCVPCVAAVCSSLASIGSDSLQHCKSAAQALCVHCVLTETPKSYPLRN